MNRLPLNLPELHIGSVETVSNGVMITAHSTVWTASCPQCSVISQSIHSYYRRRVDDLPLGGQLTQLIEGVTT
jgi:transposase